VADSTAEYDILGICRPQGAGFDMGAYEYIGLPQVALTMSAVGSGEVFPAVGMHPFQQGTILTCHVTPTLWWRFQGWSGAITDTASAISLTMDANKSLTATFVKPAVEQITGVVTDWRSGLGLPDASVTVTETDLGREICSDTTDVNGAFGLDAPGETLLDVAITKGEGGAEGEGEPPCQLSLFGCCLLR